jgi:hypothetical protein
MIGGIEGVTRRKQPKQPMPESVARRIIYISDHYYHTIIIGAVLITSPYSL